MSNLDRLHEAGVLNAENLSDDDKTTVESITPQEVDVLINLRQKFGEASDDNDQLRPNIGV